jgi:hypothetical protein
MVEIALAALLMQAPAIAGPPTICIETWRGDETLRAAVEDAMSSALLQTKKFRLTENCAKAAYVLKGSVVERADIRSRSEGESAGIASIAGSVVRHSDGSGGGGFGGSSNGSSEALSTTETKRQVTLSAKLVDSDGEVLLATTQDSGASKGKSALTEASEKLAREITRKLFPTNSSPVEGKIDKSGYVKVK